MVTAGCSQAIDPLIDFKTVLLLGLLRPSMYKTGLKTTINLIKRGRAKIIFLATDMEDECTRSDVLDITRAAWAKRIPVIYSLNRYHMVNAVGGHRDNEAGIGAITICDLSDGKLSTECRQLLGNIMLLAAHARMTYVSQVSNLCPETYCA